MRGWKGQGKDERHGKCKESREGIGKGWNGKEVEGTGRDGRVWMALEGKGS